MPPFARRRFGQNFLVDLDAVARIVELLSPHPGEPLLEIGPGRGVLTEALIERAGRTAAVEIDRELAGELERRFDPRQLLLIQDDILRVDLGRLARELTTVPGRGLVVAGNLPYNVSKPIAMKLIRERAAVDRAVLMFQREVAQRITASPGGREYGPLSVLAGATYEVRSVFDLRPGAFRPRPKVVSTVTHWQRRPIEDLSADAEERLRVCLRVCFGGRRKTLRNNLRAALGRAADAVLEAAGVDGGMRPEQVTPEGFRRLSTGFAGKGL